MGLSDLVVPDEHAGRLMKTPRVVGKEEGFDWDVYMAWNIQSYIEPSCAPPGKHLFTAYLPLTEQEALNKELVIKVVDAIPDFLESVYPGFKDTIEWELYPVCLKLEGVAKSVSQAGQPQAGRARPGGGGALLRRRHRARLRGGHGLRLLLGHPLRLRHNRPRLRRALMGSGLELTDNLLDPLLTMTGKIGP